MKTTRLWYVWSLLVITLPGRTHRVSVSWFHAAFSHEKYHFCIWWNHTHECWYLHKVLHRSDSLDSCLQLVSNYRPNNNTNSYGFRCSFTRNTPFLWRWGGGGCPPWPIVKALTMKIHRLCQQCSSSSVVARRNRHLQRLAPYPMEYINVSLYYILDIRDCPTDGDWDLFVNSAPCWRKRNWSIWSILI